MLEFAERVLNVPSHLDLENISWDASLDTSPDNVKPFPFHGILSLTQESLQGSKLNQHGLNAGMGRDSSTQVRLFRVHENTETLAQGLIYSRDESTVPHRVQTLVNIAACQAQ